MNQIYRSCTSAPLCWFSKISFHDTNEDLTLSLWKTHVDVFHSEFHRLLRLQTESIVTDIKTCPVTVWTKRRRRGMLTCRRASRAATHFHGIFTIPALIWVIVLLVGTRGSVTEHHVSRLLFLTETFVFLCETRRNWGHENHLKRNQTNQRGFVFSLGCPPPCCSSLWWNQIHCEKLLAVRWRSASGMKPEVSFIKGFLQRSLARSASH